MDESAFDRFFSNLMRWLPNGSVAEHYAEAGAVYERAVFHTGLLYPPGWRRMLRRLVCWECEQIRRRGRTIPLGGFLACGRETNAPVDEEWNEWAFPWEKLTPYAAMYVRLLERRRLRIPDLALFLRTCRSSSGMPMEDSSS